MGTISGISVSDLDESAEIPSTEDEEPIAITDTNLLVAIAEKTAGSGEFQSAGSQTPISENPADRETLLFNKFLAGDDRAYRVLYDAYERPLYLYYCKILNNETEAQDIFQDIWVRMFKLRGQRETISKFSGLLFTIARNLCLNSIRDNKHLPDISIDDVPSDHLVFLRTVEHDETDIREMLQRALQQLPFNQREAFVLREYSGY